MPKKRISKNPNKRSDANGWASLEASHPKTSMVMRVIAAVGVVAVAIAAPNAVQLFSGLAPKKQWNKDTARRHLHTLSQRGYVRLTRRGKHLDVELTNSGRDYVAYLIRKEEARRAMTVKKWDGKWRIIIFDIPESKRAIRDRFRSIVKEVGFYRLQDSVWVYPFSCERFVAILREELGGVGNILVIFAQSIEHDEQLRKHFSLSNS